MENLYSIMPLDTSHLEEICIDISNQYKNGVTSCALFKMTLVPEGTPPKNKAKEYCEKYLRFKARLDALGVPSGVLAQATIGHGWVLGEKFPFQHICGLNGIDGQNSVCPYDEGFLQYIYDTFREIALCKPHHIMVDDDFRLLGRSSGGCACPLHMREFAKRSGEQLTREELFEIISSGTEKSEKYSDIFVETQKSSLVECASVMRKAIDDADASIPASYCCVGTNAEFAAEIAKTLSGNGNPVIVRINNGNYAAAGARFFSNHFFRAASQIEKLKDSVDIILAETDTCPQNRYSTSAYSLHTHFTGSILEGVNGAKQWITRLMDYEPESGIAYRKILSKYSDFYKALIEITPTLSWHGCRVNVRKTAVFKPGVSHYYGEKYSGWGRCVLERFGVPMYFSSENGGALFLDGKSEMTDDEILSALKGTVFLASDTAKELIDRGFGEYIGVDVCQWHGKNIKGEKLCVNDCRVSAQANSMELKIADTAAKADSFAYTSLSDDECTPLFPASVVFKNKLGGNVITFCGTPDTEYNIFSGVFSFLNYSRKLQLINLLRKTDNLPVYYPNDEEVYLKAASMPDGGLFCAVFNLGLDPIEKTELVFEKCITKIERLMPDGSRKVAEFEKDGEKYIIDAPSPTLSPLILFAY